MVTLRTIIVQTRTSIQRQGAISRVRNIIILMRQFNATRCRTNHTTSTHHQKISLRANSLTIRNVRRINILGHGSILKFRLLSIMQRHLFLAFSARNHRRRIVRHSNQFSRHSARVNTTSRDSLLQFTTRVVSRRRQILRQDKGLRSRATISVNTSASHHAFSGSQHTSGKLSIYVRRRAHSVTRK